jgi:hypothetical protein
VCRYTLPVASESNFAELDLWDVSGDDRVWIANNNQTTIATPPLTRCTCGGDLVPFHVAVDTCRLASVYIIV